MRPRAPFLQSAARLAAWLVLIGLILATVVPIEFRPHSGLSVQAERFLGFAAAGALLALAYPRRPWLAVLLLGALAIALELAQFLAATRHPGVPDLLAKLAGGGAGLVVGWGLNLIASALSRGHRDA